MINQFSKKVGKRGKGLAHFDYAHAIGKFEYKSAEVVLADFANMPYWAKDDPREFWKSADEFERANGNSYLEHQFALPRELNAEQWKAFIDDWCKEQFGDKHPYSYAIHCPMGSDGLPNPHVHLMYSERTLDEHDRPREQFFKRYNSKHPERGGARKDVQAKTTTERKNELKELRHEWGEKVKECLRSHGFDKSAEQVDMRNWRERGLTEPPKNKTLKQINMEKRLADMVGVSSYDFKQDKEQDYDKSRIDDIKRAIEQRKRDFEQRSTEASINSHEVATREQGIDSRKSEFESRKSTLERLTQRLSEQVQRIREQISEFVEKLKKEQAPPAPPIEPKEKEMTLDEKKALVNDFDRIVYSAVDRLRLSRLEQAKETEKQIADDLEEHRKKEPKGGLMSMFKNEMPRVEWENRLYDLQVKQRTFKDAINLADPRPQIHRGLIDEVKKMLQKSNPSEFNRIEQFRKDIELHYNQQAIADIGRSRSQSKDRGFER